MLLWLCLTLASTLQNYCICTSVAEESPWIGVTHKHAESPRLASTSSKGTNRLSLSLSLTHTHIHTLSLIRSLLLYLPSFRFVSVLFQHSVWRDSLFNFECITRPRFHLRVQPPSSTNPIRCGRRSDGDITISTNTRRPAMPDRKTLVFICLFCFLYSMPTYGYTYSSY